jgi:glutathione S-transferase
VKKGAAVMSALTLELWQTEWCPASHRVRQRLTELGLSYLVQQVPVEKQDRTELVRSTGHESIPVLVASGNPIAGEEAILGYLKTHFVEPPEAENQRCKAAKAKRKELENACQQLAAATH